MLAWKVTKPTFDPANKSYVLLIQDPSVLSVDTADPTKIIFEGRAKEYLDAFCAEFLKQASPYFSKRLEPSVFYQRIAHAFSNLEDRADSSPDTFVASWIPARVTFFASRYEIQWLLTDLQIKESPGSTTVVVDNLPVSPDIPSKGAGVSVVPQKILRQKIRQARLKSALAKLHVERLVERYYTKYGTFDGFSDSDSELSSEFEFPSNES
jgi:hypothetical protein